MLTNEPIHPDPESYEALLEKLAEAFGGRDFPFAAVCLNKILRKLNPPDQDEAERARSQSRYAELQKAVNALESKDFPLAAVCFGKAIAAMELPAAIATPAMDFVRALETQDFSTAGDAVRRVRAGAGFATQPTVG